MKRMMERYGCSGATARKYIRQCNPHMENPLAATEEAVSEWELGRTVGKVERRREPKSTYVPRRR